MFIFHRVTSSSPCEYFIVRFNFSSSPCEYFIVRFNFNQPQTGS
jgi:hypothetical protein